VRERIFPCPSYGVGMTIITFIETIIVMVLPVLPIIAFMEIGRELEA
jgi:hypothetical protein